MDFEIMKKKLDAYKRPKGQYRGVKGELLIELLRMWEAQTGPSSAMAKMLGMKPKQLGRLILEARRLAQTNDTIDPAFQALQVQTSAEVSTLIGIEVCWGSDKVIRFPSVDVLLDFLKKAS